MMMRATPNVVDVVEGFDASSLEELERALRSFSTVNKAFLSTHATAQERSGLDPEDLADFIQRYAGAAKQNAKDKDHLLD